MTIEQPVIYVIVVTYNGKTWIEKCLTSVINSNIKLDCVVVDNASADATVEYIKKNFPTIEIIEAGNNIGFGQANNIGIQLGYKRGADFFLLLNQDAWLEPETIKILVSEQKKKPEFWILTPLQKKSSSDQLEYQFKKYLDKNQINLKQNGIQKVDFANAAIWLITRQCVEIVGGFDPLFPQYGEDNDYVRRLHYWGGKIGVVTQSTGYHDRELDNKIDVEKQINRTTLAITGLLKNINSSMPCLIINEIRRLLVKSIKYCIKLDLSSLYIYNKAFFCSIGKMKQIREHREKSIEEGAFIKL